MVYKKNFDFNTEDYKTLSKSQLKKMCDYWVRRYLLSKAKKNGRNEIKCPLKNKYYKKEKINVSHFIDRACMNTRYDLNNIFLISEDSNVWDAKIQVEGYKSLHHKEYEEWLREKLGKKEFDNLLVKSKKIRIFADQDYIELIKKFRNV
jgi:hypothetical protein